MAINQDNQAELRYIKRQNLEQESKLVQGYYRDIIRSYGVDCKYYKLKTIYPEVFDTIINKNNMVRAAYGYEPDPSFQISAELITYMEVENDIFQLNKIGAFPTTNVNFYFDSNDFAVGLASKLGQYKEYKLHDNSISVEFSLAEMEELDTIRLPFETDILSGMAAVTLGDLVIDFSKEFSVPADVVESSPPHLDFPVNEYIYKSFQYELTGANPDDCIVNFKFKLQEPYPGQYVLSGKLDGAVLFRDFTAISKYKSAIHPEAGDVVTIDFPDAKSREQYEITEATDINLAQDGVNPLLHKYIWKCKAIRYVPNASRRIPEENEENRKIEEKFDLVARADEEIARKISMYPNNEDYIYGTYSRPGNQVEANAIPESRKKISFEEIEDNGSLIDIMRFANGSCLKTNGFDLFFQNASGKWFKLTQFKDDNKTASLQEEVQFLKATDNVLVFVNLSGEHKKLCQDFKDKDELAELSATELESQFCLDSLNSVSEYTNGHVNINKDGDEFYKFSNCQTLLMSIEDNLFCKLGESKKIFKLN